jgi:hypothetical protein
VQVAVAKEEEVAPRANAYASGCGMLLSDFNKILFKLTLGSKKI